MVIGGDKGANPAEWRVCAPELDEPQGAEGGVASRTAFLPRRCICSIRPIQQLWYLRGT